MQRVALFSLLLLSIGWPGTYLYAMVARNDGDYLKNEVTTDQAEHELIYTAPLRPYLPRVRTLLDQVDQIYQASFNVTLSEKNSVILADPLQNQIANAFATTLPNSQTTFFGGGAPYLDYFASASWLATVIPHEMAHLYQLSAKGELPERTRQIFGNHFAFFYPLIPLPIFIYPNALLPTWLLEGNAVLNECRFRNGGRLYSGYARALVNYLAKHQQLTPLRLLNNHLEFPYGEEKYLVGGHFNLFLAQKFGIDRVNQFFRAHGDHWLLPLILERTFERHFGQSYSALVEQFLAELIRQAQSMQDQLTQELAAGPILAHSSFLMEMNRVGSQILFLTNPSGQAPNQLNIYDLESGNFSVRPTMLPQGKVFKVADQLVARASAITPDKKVIYALWNEQQEALKDSQGKYLLAQADDGRNLYFDIAQSFEQGALYLDELALGQTPSQALMSSDGEYVCYFRQIQDQRELICNQKVVARYAGYYGKLVAVTSEGEVYFLAATEYGQAIFYTRANRVWPIERLTSIEHIADAAILDSQRAMVALMAPSGFDYRIIQLRTGPSSGAQQPTRYRYFFEQQTGGSFDLKTASDSSEDLAWAQNERTYNFMRDWRFNYWLIQATSQASQTGMDYLVRGSWSDPMQKNNLQLSHLMRTAGGTEESDLHYTNRAFAFDLLGELTYYSNRSLEDRSRHWEMEVGLRYPYRFYELWQSELFFAERLERDFAAASWSEKYALSFERQEIYPMALLTHSTHLARAEVLADWWSTQTRVQFGHAREITAGNWIQAEAVAHWNGAHQYGGVEWGETLTYAGYSFSIPTIETLYTGPYVRITRYALGYQHLFEHAYYFSRFPLSLRRWAPHVFGAWFDRQRTNASPKQMPEYGVGATFDLLLAHLLPVSAKLSYVKNRDDQQWLLTFGSGQSE